MKMYAGLDDKTLDLLAMVDVAAFGEANLEFQTIVLTFLPDELEIARKSMKIAKSMIASDERWLADRDQHERVLDALATAGDSAHVMNVATQMMIVLDLFERHQEDLKDLWLKPDGTVRHKGTVPLRTIGLDRAPADDAAKINKACKAMIDRQEVEEPWQALVAMAKTYLGEE